MGMTTDVRIDCPVEVQGVFDQAMTVIGLDPVADAGLREDYTDEASTIWQATRRDGVADVERAALHFRADGTRLDEEYECGEAYVLISLETGDLGGGNTVEQHRARHRQMLEQFGSWLTGQGLEWRYRHEFEAPPWALGHSGTASGAA